MTIPITFKEVILYTIIQFQSCFFRGLECQLELNNGLYLSLEDSAMTKKVYSRRSCGVETVDIHAWFSIRSSCLPHNVSRQYVGYLLRPVISRLDKSVERSFEVIDFFHYNEPTILEWLFARSIQCPVCSSRYTRSGLSNDEEARKWDIQERFQDYNYEYLFPIKFLTDKISHIFRYSRLLYQIFMKC